MPRYPVPSNEVTAGKTILPNGEYVFDIGNITLFDRVREKDGANLWGFKALISVASGESNIGKSLGNMDFYMHTSGAAEMSKRFLMAAHGYEQNQASEALFNETFPDIGFDPDESDLPAHLARLVGKQVAAAVTIGQNKMNPEEQQNKFRWLPVV